MSIIFCVSRGFLNVLRQKRCMRHGERDMQEGKGVVRVRVAARAGYTIGFEVGRVKRQGERGFTKEKNLQRRKGIYKSRKSGNQKNLRERGIERVLRA